MGQMSRAIVQDVCPCPVQDDKSPCAAVMICATWVNTHTHTHTSSYQVARK